MKVPDRDEWFFTEHGLPRPEWSAFRGWVRAYFGEDPKGEAWGQFVPHWLDRLSAALGNGYTVSESAHFLLLSQFDRKGAANVLAWLEASRLRIVNALGNAAWTNGKGKHVFLRFGNHDDYYRYIAYFYPDGSHATSAGVFLSRNYAHIALTAGTTAQSERSTMVHEMTHNLLGHLPLPRWIDEGLAMEFQTILVGGHQTVDRELQRKHKAYWNEETIQRFWMGASFGRVRSQRLSYNLAWILRSNIQQGVQPKPDAMRRFVLQCDASDAGAAASREQLDLELSDLVASFLGEGDWQPKPETWNEIHKKMKDEPDESDEEDLVEETEIPEAE